MGTKRKFKADSKLHVGVFYFANGALLLLSALVLRTDLYLRFLVVALAGVVLVNLLFAIRTRNWFYSLPALNYLLVAVMIWSRVWAGPVFAEKMRLFLAAAYVINLVLLVMAGMKRKLKWRREEALELAAQPLAETAGGFTPRPFVVGRIDCNAEELAAFSRFLFRHLVAIPYLDKEKLVLVLAKRPIDHLLKLRRNWDRDSWVSFDAAGNITVSIVQSDYLHYANGYTFDLLCASAGQLFSDYFDLQRCGRGREIIDRFDALRLPPFTGALVGF